MRELGLEWHREYQFHPKRKWRADYVIFPARISPTALVEIHGGVYAQGHHTRGKGFEDDREKANTAQALGFRIYEFSTGQVLSGYAKEFLKENL